MPWTDNKDQTTHGSPRARTSLSVWFKSVLGGSYSTSSGFGLLLEYAERNFLGRGQDFRLKYNSGVGSRTYSLGFVEPEFLSPDLSLGFTSKFTETEKENSN